VTPKKAKAKMIICTLNVMCLLQFVFWGKEGPTKIQVGLCANERWAKLRKNKTIDRLARDRLRAI
jgi:hypothetical protein